MNINRTEYIRNRTDYNVLFFNHDNQIKISCITSRHFVLRASFGTSKKQRKSNYLEAT